MVDPDGTTPFTAHTLSDVPFVVCADGVRGLRPGGKLADVAPTLLDLIGVRDSGGVDGQELADILMNRVSGHPSHC